MVYVDDPIYPFGNMKMCHMMADTLDELHSNQRLGSKENGSNPIRPTLTMIYPRANGSLLFKVVRKR